MKRVLGYILCDLDVNFMVEGQIMHFLVNASTPYQLQILHVHRQHDLEGTGNIWCDLDQRVNVKSRYCIFL